MITFDTFTDKQKETYALVHDLDHKLMQAIDPASFVLNDEVLEIRRQIEEVQNNCNHIWEKGFCAVCGKEATHE